MNFSWDKGHKYLSITNYYKVCQENKKEYPNDPDVRTKGWWGIHTNRAKKGIDSCLDLTIGLGYIEINYTNFNY